MFTFGREYEEECAIRNVRGQKNIELAQKTVNAVHDFLDNRISQLDFKSAIWAAFFEGGSGVWEQAVNWLRRLGRDVPNLLTLWFELAQHQSSKIRFRAACCLPDMTPEYAAKVGTLLISDSSKKVREMAVGKQSLSSYASQIPTQ